MVQYSLRHAAVINGPYAETVANRLKEIAKDEQEHANKLRDRIAALGVVPTMETAKKELIAASNLKQIIAVNLKFTGSLVFSSTGSAIALAAVISVHGTAWAA
jgi:bacterioferritin (cytochrome b1)